MYMCFNRNLRASLTLVLSDTSFVLVAGKNKITFDLRTY